MSLSQSFGLSYFLRARIRIPIAASPPLPRCRSQFSTQSPLISTATSCTTQNKVQIYVSRTNNPYLNLSIEHYLLQKSHPESTILFLYTNHPCVVIGRNQNPWVEVNLNRLRESPLKPDLVRRRSGGGAVFHDEGNVNYSVICPPRDFHRDKHAQMVVRALHKTGVKKARVNERHDIVVDSSKSEEGFLKVSGSAYKITRTRSLHHATCLLNSTNIESIGTFLRSPAKKFMEARGVDSVSSPITNVNLRKRDFEQAVIDEFGKMYEAVKPVILTEEEGNIPEITAGIRELISQDWIYGQTPQFTFTYQSNGECAPSYTDDTKKAPPPSITFTARNAAIQSATLRTGRITDDDWNSSTEQVLASSLQETQEASMKGIKLHDIEDWREVLRHVIETKAENTRRVQLANPADREAIEKRYNFERAWEEDLRLLARNLNHQFGMAKSNRPVRIKVER